MSSTKNTSDLGLSSSKLFYSNAYTVYTLLVEKAGVAPDVILKFTACKQVRVQAREPPWDWNP